MGTSLLLYIQFINIKERYVYGFSLQIYSPRVFKAPTLIQALRGDIARHYVEPERFIAFVFRYRYTPVHHESAYPFADVLGMYREHMDNKVFALFQIYAPFAEIIVSLRILAQHYSAAYLSVIYTGVLSALRYGVGCSLIARVRRVPERIVYVCLQVRRDLMIQLDYIFIMCFFTFDKFHTVPFDYPRISDDRRRGSRQSVSYTLTIRLLAPKVDVYLTSLAILKMIDRVISSSSISGVSNSS